MAVSIFGVSMFRLGPEVARLTVMMSVLDGGVGSVSGGRSERSRVNGLFAPRREEMEEELEVLDMFGREADRSAMARIECAERVFCSLFCSASNDVCGGREAFCI